MISISGASAQDVLQDTLTGHVAGIRQELDVLKRIKVSGYIQAQYQVTDSGGAKSFAGGDFAAGVDKRFQVRRGRIKFVYDAPNIDKGWSTSQYQLQFDVTQNGLTIKDAFAKFTDPWCGWFSLTAGMQNRPFGYEVVYSSSLRESPERGRMSQIIFPNERDLGAMVSIQGPKVSNWNWVKIDLGMFNGTGAPGVANIVNGTASGTSNSSDFDKFKDFIGHVGLSKSSSSETIKWGLGASIYSGGFRQDSVNFLKTGLDSASVMGFVIDKKKSAVSAYINNRDEVKRDYIGVDAQLSIDWMMGLTTIRGEYIEGKQPATSGSSTSPNAQVLSDIYLRKFNGAYFYFLQNIGTTPLQAIVKYDWYDPNTDVSGDEVGKSVKAGTVKSNVTDLKFTTLGLGLAYRWDVILRIAGHDASRATCTFIKINI